MGKILPLTNQVIKILNSKTEFGHSKHDSKKEKIKELKEIKYNELKASGEKIKMENIKIPSNQIHLDGIYSYKSFETYKQKSIQFVRWIQKEHPEVNFIRETQKFAPEYLQSLVDRGLAATSISGHGSALAKLFGKSAETFYFKFPEKHQKDISKGRGEQKWDKSISKNYGTELVVLATIGLRRHEAVGLKTTQISENYTTINGVKGKNGKIRSIEVLDPQVLKNYVESHKNEKQKVFARLPKQMNVQRERRNYANTFYKRELDKVFPDKGKINYQETDKNGHLVWYKTRGGIKTQQYYKPILARVSKNLGHARLEVVVRNYLK